MYWFEDINEILNRDNILDFWPSKYQSYESKVNSLTRFILYAGILLSLYNTNTIYIIISLFLIFLIALNVEKQIRKPKKNNVHKCTNPKIMKNVKQDCQKPTDDNPFGNVLINDYTDNPTKLPACSIEAVEDDVNKKFRKNLYMDIDSIYEKENSERQFYSTANTTIPNDQVNFAKWLYQVNKNCKTNPKDCL